MKYVIKASLGNPNIPENGVATVYFPLSGSEYSHSIAEVLEPMGIGSAVVQDCFVEEIDSSYGFLQCLKQQIVNVDELDYLAKRLDSFCDSEAEGFQAACSAFGCRDIKDLINMTFCCQETTVISDFSKLEEAGKAHYLTIHGGAAPTAELAAVDGRALAEKLIQSGEGMLTPYGLFFRNGVRMENLYQGRGFPPYLWDEREAELELIKPDGTKALVFLPFTALELRRFQQREDIPDIRECKGTLHLYHGPARHIDLSDGMAELEGWNKLCEALKAMPQMQQQAFAAALEVTGAEDLSQMQLLAASMDDFELIPGITDAESYGKYMIQQSGKYDYDEFLECYYNYEAFGEFLMEHETGQITKRGYLKCEEGSSFLDFFTQKPLIPTQEQVPADEESTMQIGGPQ